jgi:2-polyprenyl-3-methyl-5-hydroxy-6-metoxy-1,4-benzoquinol methylase
VSQASLPVIHGSERYAKHCRPLQFDRTHPHWSIFFGGIAGELIRSLPPTRVFDAGYAHGLLVEAFWARGVEAPWREISEFAISHARSDIEKCCYVSSIGDQVIDRFDLVLCIEVVEHA